MCMKPLHLHVTQKSDYDYDDEKAKISTTNLLGEAGLGSGSSDTEDCNK